ncbi:MAG TPA: polymer-forming cytoskeletal protein [Candidatus Methylomirabilis sp.]|nr:polymer-forming cytoskeletal protein [Candidatus Methylomirabilis sp.]
MSLKFFSQNSLEQETERGGHDLGELHAFLGEGIQFKGEVTCAGAFRVDGCLEGQIVRSEVLVVGERGEVKAEIEVDRLVVSGQVNGNITARQRVELLGASRVTGTIRTPCMVVVEGAILDGKCEMADAAPA